MLRENQYILRQVNIALDLLLSVAAFFIAFVVRLLLNEYVFPDWRVTSLATLLPLLPLVPVAAVAALLYNGLYNSQRLRTRTRELTRRITLACFEATLLISAAIFMIKGNTISRPFICILPFVLLALLVAKTWVIRHALMRVRRQGYNYRRVILIGSGPPLAQIAGMIAGQPLWGLRIDGIITDRPECQAGAFDAATVPEGALDLPVLSDLGRAPEVLWRTPVDEVIFTPDAVPLSHLRPLMEICEEMGVRTHLPLNFFNTRIAHPVVDRFDDLPVLSYWPTQVIGPALLFKYAFDRVAAAAALALAAPLLLAATLAIRLTSRRGEPVLFSQTRCGLNGRLFTVYKFRSMYVDAERRRAGLAALNEQAGPVFKMRRDPRVTPVGRWLRKLSIDELPQLWNVVRGDMSLVGPRPPLPSEVEQYDRWQRRRLSMKPGITCLWQVMGRNKLPFETWMKLDLQYIDNWSLPLDFKILARTVYVVLTGYGAM